MTKPAAISTPHPVTVVRNHREMTFTTPVIRHHPLHYLHFAVRMPGLYRLDDVDLPEYRPVFSFQPAGTRETVGLVGFVEGWYVGFEWPGLETSPCPGQREFDVAWNGRSLRVPRFKPVEAAMVPKLVDRFTAMQKNLSRQDLAGAALVRAQVMDLFALYLDLPMASAEAMAHRSLVKFYDLLRDKACDPISIEQMAKQVGMSADHLRELFLERFGTQPVKYRTGLRLAKAWELLSSTSLSVQEVAKRIGYPDALYFSRVFKNQYGMSPRDMIKHFRLIGSDGGR
jgi:AraC-like DNA-binding protein